MSGRLLASFGSPLAPLAPVPLQDCPPFEPSSHTAGTASRDDSTAGTNGDAASRYAPLALARDPLVVAEAFARALADPLVAAERGTFDRMAREFRTALATVRPTDAPRFAARLDAAIDAVGEQAIEWSAPTMPPLPVNGSSIGENVVTTAIETSRDGADEYGEEASIVSINRLRDTAPRAERKGPLLNDWRAQLATMAAGLPARGTVDQVEARRDRGRQARIAVADAPPSPAPAATASPAPDLAALVAHRARLVETDRKQRARAEAALAERQALLDGIARHEDELAAIQHERDLTRQALADAFTDEARAGLASIATEIERLEKGCVAALATTEWSLARLERRPEVAALLARRGREEECVADMPGAAGATRRLPAEATATVPPVAICHSDDLQVRALASANEYPNDPDQPALPEKVGQTPVAVKRPAALDTVERARQLLRVGDADGAIGLLGGLDARGLDREVERQIVGVLFAAAEASARAGGMDDFRFLRLDRGTRVLLACEPRADYAAGDAATAPTYRVVATYGVDGDRFAPGQTIPAGLLERAQPRRARA